MDEGEPWTRPVGTGADKSASIRTGPAGDRCHGTADQAIQGGVALLPMSPGIQA